MKISTLVRFMKFWPPYWGAGIRVSAMAKDFTWVEVEMKLRFWNKNAVGTQFGGSLYSMVDPFLMLILLEHLGKDFIVWDKAATIRFKKPGKGKVRARMGFTLDEIQKLREQTLQQTKIEPSFNVSILDDSGAIIAEVEKLLYIKKKP